MKIRCGLLVLMTALISHPPRQSCQKAFHFVRSLNAENDSSIIQPLDGISQPESAQVKIAAKSVGTRHRIVLVEGTLHVTFHPQWSGGSGGSWQPVIISPSGIRIPGPIVPHDSLDPIVVDVNAPCEGVVEAGCYGVELKNSIQNAAPSLFLGSSVVTFEGAAFSFEAVRLQAIPPTFEGEKSVIPYVFPALSCACSE